MKRFAWNRDKDALLQRERGVGFEIVLQRIANGGLLDVLEHPNPKRYAGQRVFVVNVAGYAVLVPFVESDDEIFLKTIIPSRKATKRYLRAGAGPSPP